MKDNKLYVLIAAITGLLLALAVLETLAFHDELEDVTVTDSREPELTRYSIDLFIDVYKVTLSYDWRSPKMHGTSDGIGERLTRGDEISARIGRITGLMLGSKRQGASNHLVFEPSFLLALISFLVYLIRAARHPIVFLIAACVQAYAGIWLGIAIAL